MVSYLPVGDVDVLQAREEELELLEVEDAKQPQRDDLKGLRLGFRV